jgi:hypothetical protein
MGIMTKEQFNSTINMIISEFPLTENWLNWHMENCRGPLIFCPIADECISGFGTDTNGEEGIGGWIKRSYGLSKPSFKQAVLHLVLFSKSVQEDYDDTIQGKETRYGKIKSPEERAQVRKRKRRTLAEYFVSDGQPPDTSKDLPLDDDFNDVRAYFIPFGFSKDSPSLTTVLVTATNTCSMNTVLMALFLIRKSYNYMLHYFIQDCSGLNSSLNLDELNQTAHARFMWLDFIANHPTVDATWMCHVTSRNGRPMWNCWLDDFVHFRTLTMMKFIEVEEVGLCYKCGRISTTTAVPMKKPIAIPMVRIVYPSN